MSTGTVPTPHPHPPEVDPIKAKFEQFVEALMATEISDAELRKMQAENAVQIAEGIHDRNKFTFEKAERFFQEYNEIKKQIAVKLAQLVEELVGSPPANGMNGGSMQEVTVGNIETATTLTTGLATKIDSTIACIKLTNEKFLTAFEKAQDLCRIIKDQCNQLEFKELDQKIGLGAKADAIKDKVEHVCTAAGNCLNTAIKVAGTAALIDPDNLSDLGNDMRTCIDAFLTDIDDKLSTGSSELDTATQGCYDAIKGKCKAEDDLEKVTVELNALLYLKAFAEPHAHRTIPKTIDQIVEEAKKNYANPIAPTSK